MKTSLIPLTVLLSVLHTGAQSLSNALDQTGLVWTTSGSAAWVGQTNVTHDGVDAAQSGTAGGSFDSWLQTTITGPGSLSFWWKQTSGTQFGSILRIEMGGTILDYLRGETDWQPASFFIPAGTQTLRWTYSYDINSNAGPGAWLDQVSFEPNDLPTILGRAVDNTNLVWTSGGNAVWTGQPAVTHDGVDAATSQKITAGQQSWQQTTVTGPGTLAFWWQVSSEMDFDYLELRTNGVLQSRISGEVGWQQVSLTIPAGSNTLRWSYVKDDSTDLGQDRGWLDQVVFQPQTGVPVILAQPGSRRVGLGDTITLAPGIGGAVPRTYQWYFNETNLLAGATNATLTLTNIQPTTNGGYRIAITNAAGAAISSNALLTVTTNGPIQTILLFADDYPIRSRCRDALNSLGLTYQVFTNRNPNASAGHDAFNAAVTNADPGTTLVIVDAPWYNHSFNAVGDFANAGGRAILSYWGMTEGSALASAFQARVLQLMYYSRPVYNWGSPIFDLISSPLPFTDTYEINGQLLQPTPGGQAVAGYWSSSPTTNEAAVVVGHSGRTYLNGFNLPEITSAADAVWLARNEIAELMGIPPPVSTVRYVNLNNTSPAPPYTNWATAATTIQDAIDASTRGDQILMTNGVYKTGGRIVPGAGGTNRVVVNQALTIQSVNGPEVTVIEGHQATTGDYSRTDAIRCVYLANGASLSGFTLTNGDTALVAFQDGGQGGGVYCEYVNAVLTNCVLTGNSAIGAGGGVFLGTLNNCTLTGNSAVFGGGAAGGYYPPRCILNNCTLTDNTARTGGGAAYSTLNNCTLTGNSAADSGGGAYDSTLDNCTVSGNTASQGNGGGVTSGTLNNCTLVNNSARSGGGALYSTLNNCIVYYNSATADADGNYDSTTTLNYCCTTPLPANGIGNLTLEPQLASASHLSANSPCISQGAYASASGVDIDGEPWANPPAIGCDQYYSGSLTGMLSVAVVASYTNVATSFSVDFQGMILGRVSASRWEFSDGTIVSNRPNASHAWIAAGDYPVVLRAYNESYPAGVTAVVMVHVIAQPVHYVASDSASPAAPYTSWATAANNIQDAVDAANVPGALVLVTNGTYATGGQEVNFETNRVAVNKPLVLQSVNGPQFTLIDGGGTIRCAYLTNGSSMGGFTLTNGVAAEGGGVWCQSPAVLVSDCVLAGNSAYSSGGGAHNGTLNNCALTGNSAYYGGGASSSTLNNCTLRGNTVTEGEGGGAYRSTLNNCALTDNSAPYGGGADGCILNNCTLTGNSADSGGGAFASSLNNCTLTGNWAQYGGGAVYGTLNNSIVFFNTAPFGPNYYQDDSTETVLNYCCTTPLPANGVGNIDAEPLLTDAVHLAASSPCRGAGSPAHVSGMDIDGQPWADPPAIGCDEYYGGPVTGALSVALRLSYTNVAAGFTVQAQGMFTGHATASRWELGDGTILSNRPSVTHAWSAAGDYPVVLRAYNDSFPAGVAATTTVHVVTQPIHHVAADSVNPAAPYNSWATAATNIQDAVDAAAVPGAVVLVTNGIYSAGGRVGGDIGSTRVVVDRILEVRSVTGPQFTLIDGGGTMRCAYLTNGSSLAGFTLTNGDAGLGGGVMCQSVLGVVSNCVLSGNLASESGGAAAGGTLNNCILSGNSSSGRGGAATTATLVNCSLVGNTAYSWGGGAESCTLIDCTLTTNSAGSGGGAVYYGTLERCILNGNTADWGGGGYYASFGHCTLTHNSATNAGGGAYGGTLDNCVVAGNTAVEGGGANFAALNNCTVLSNSATRGGGVFNCSVNNSIVYYNSAIDGANYAQEGTNFFVVLNYCCSTPLPTDPYQFGNITNAPLFVNLAGGNLRLQPSSPCINSGHNPHAPAGPDFAGNVRIVGGTVDMGVYEFQSPTSVISYAWLQQYGIALDGSADYADSDTDLMNNWQEWIAGTIPTDDSSALQFFHLARDAFGITVTWQSVMGRTYSLERATNLGAAPTFSLLISDIAGQAGTTSYTDTTAIGPGPFFYRVGVQP